MGYKHSIFKIFVSISIVFVLLFSAVACKNETKTPAPQAATQNVNSEPEIDFEQSKKLSIFDYKIKTVSDLRRLWGSDFAIKNELYGGKWACIYYEDNRCPFIFGVAAQTVPERINGNEAISGIIVYPNTVDSADYHIIDELKIASGYSAISTKLPGEFVKNETDNTNSLSGNADGIYKFVFNWGANIETAPNEIIVSFDRSLFG